MCYDEGTLQELLDGEYQGDMLELRRHLGSCEACRERYEALKAQETLVKNALHIGYEEKQEELQRTLMAIQHTKKRKDIRMKRMHWGVKGAAAAVLCGALVFTAPGAALADQFLNLFRTQDVQAIAITNEDILQLGNIFEDGAGKVEIDRIGTFETVSQGEPQHLDTLGDPGILKAHMPRAKVIPLGLGMKYDGGAVIPKTEMRFTLHVAPLNDLLKAMGKETAFPDSLDGKTFSLGTDNAVGYTVQLPEEKGRLHAAVSGMPVVGLPEGTDHRMILGLLKDTGLLPQGLASSLVGMGDLATVMPIPYAEESQTKTETTINGNKAVILQEKEYDSFTIFMKADDLLYIYSGSDMTAEDAVKLIETQE